MKAPARAALERAAAERERSGTENRGFVSEEHGLLPIEPPHARLPESHRVWDQTAARLPELFRSVTGREQIDAMPLLDAGEDALPDAALLRAATVLGHLAHSYVRVRPDPPDALPSCIHRPWTTVCRRLGRERAVLTYDDLIAYNWRMLDRQDRRRHLDNLAVLTPTVANREERIFYMVQVELHARTAPAIGSMVRAQEAVLAGDEAALGVELARLIDILDDATHAFLKIDPNPHSPTYMDPVVWAKTVAPFAVAISQDTHAISGAAAPAFQVLDVFVGRRSYNSRVGREASLLRPGFSQNLRDLMEALGSAPVGDFAASSSPAIRGLWHSLLEAFAGERGFLGVHRRKAYAFLEIAFKVGRSVTTGGFSGLFEDQTWDVADRELEASRRERPAGSEGWHPVAYADGSGRLASDGLVHLRLDVRDAGLRFRPGDRLAIQPRNSDEAVERTIRALRATGAEPISLDTRWRAVTGLDWLPLRDVIRRGRIRPVGRAVAKALLSFSESEPLARIVHRRTESSWELWDLLELMNERGFDARSLWRAAAWEPYALPKIVTPESPRLYSIASPMDNRLVADSVELLASELRYSQEPTDVTPAAERKGTASAYLRRLAELGDRDAVPVHVVPASRFRLPDDPQRPIVLFAGGAGISAFRSFVAERRGSPDAGPVWILLSTRSERLRDLYAREARDVHFDAVVTGDAPRSVSRHIADLIAENATDLEALAKGDAVFYICGPAGFSAAVVDALERLLSRDTVRSLIGHGRLQQDVFTSADRSDSIDATYDASDISSHNGGSFGYWTVIDGAVYDVSEFVHRHPGGAGILREVAGRDGTPAFRQIEHHLNPEVEAMLPMYRIGTVRRLDFGRRGAAAIGEDRLRHVQLSAVFRAWVRYLYLVVEIENAVRHDFGILDAVTVGGDSANRMTFLKAQLLVEAHQRFVQIYLRALLGQDLRGLWAMTTAFVAPEADVREIDRSLAARAESPASQAAVDLVTAAAERLRSLGHADSGTRERALADYAALREPLEKADLTFLAALKAGIASSVRLLERFERSTPEEAGATLLDPLHAAPGLVSELDEAVAALSRRP